MTNSKNRLLQITRSKIGPVKENTSAVGIDIEEVKRFEKYASDRSEASSLQIYTDNEINYCFSRKKTANHLALNFCAKEAVFKALCGLGFNNIELKNIEIVNSGKKNLKVNLLDDKCDCLCCNISMSSCLDKAIANALIVRRKNA